MKNPYLVPALVGVGVLAAVIASGHILAANAHDEASRAVAERVKDFGPRSIMMVWLPLHAWITLRRVQGDSESAREERARWSRSPKGFMALWIISGLALAALIAIGVVRAAADHDDPAGAWAELTANTAGAAISIAIALALYARARKIAVRDSEDGALETARAEDPDATSEQGPR